MTFLLVAHLLVKTMIDELQGVSDRAVKAESLPESPTAVNSGSSLPFIPEL